MHHIVYEKQLIILTFQFLSSDHQAASLSVHKSVADTDKTLMTQKPGKVWHFLQKKLKLRGIALWICANEKAEEQGFPIQNIYLLSNISVYIISDPFLIPSIPHEQSALQGIDSVNSRHAITLPFNQVSWSKCGVLREYPQISCYQGTVFREYPRVSCCQCRVFPKYSKVSCCQCGLFSE